MAKFQPIIYPPPTLTDVVNSIDVAVRTRGTPVGGYSSGNSLGNALAGYADPGATQLRGGGFAPIASPKNGRFVGSGYDKRNIPS